MPKTKRRKKTPRVPPRQRVADDIRALLERDDAETWVADYMVRPRMPMNIRYANSRRKRFYRSTNWLLLTLMASANEYETDYWMTFPQAKALGGRIKKGEHGAHIWFSRYTEKEEEDETTGEITTRGRRQSGVHVVFNLAQTEDIDPADVVNDYDEPDISDVPEGSEDPSASPLQLAQYALDSLAEPAPINHLDAEIPHYTPRTDRIVMPTPARFESPESYMLTKLHEVAHSTGHPARLNRPGFDRMIVQNTQVRHERGLEEMTAELTASMLAASFGIETPNLAERASRYVRHWREALRTDEREDGLTKAVEAAQKAADYILSGGAPKRAREEEE